MKSTPILIIGIIVVVAIIGYFVTQGNNTDTQNTTEITKTTEETNVPKSDEQSDVSQVESPTALSETMQTVTPSKAATPVAPAQGTYLAYSPEALASSNAERTVLFFHAPWCPSCKALDADIVKRGSEIPSDLAIFKVDYDTASELKKKYGVTRQNSIIEINKNGEALSTISHHTTLSGVLGTL